MPEDKDKTTSDADLEARTAADSSSTTPDTLNDMDDVQDSGVQEILKEMQDNPRESAESRSDKMGLGTKIGLGMGAVGLIIGSYIAYKVSQEPNMKEQAKNVKVYNGWEAELKSYTADMGSCHKADTSTMSGMKKTVKKYRMMKPIFDAYKSMGKKWDKSNDCSRLYAMNEKELLLETSKVKEELCGVNLGKKDTALKACESQNETYRNERDAARKERDGYKKQLDTKAACPEATTPVPGMKAKKQKTRKYRSRRNRPGRHTAPSRPAYDSEPGIRDITRVMKLPPMRADTKPVRRTPSYRGRR